jgi:hypothetical protein
LDNLHLGGVSNKVKQEAELQFPHRSCMMRPHRYEADRAADAAGFQFVVFNLKIQRLWD